MGKTPSYTRENYERWTLRILRHEMVTLTREQQHLEAKRAERTLNHWELSRIPGVLDELMEVMTEIARVRFQGVPHPGEQQFCAERSSVGASFKPHSSLKDLQAPTARPALMD
jgi:hypothetical protein